MREFILELDYGSTIVRNLQSIWIQPMTMQPGWMLCYEDDIYKKGIIYRSTDKSLLIEMSSKIMEAYSTGKKRIRI